MMKKDVLPAVLRIILYVVIVSAPLLLVLIFRTSDYGTFTYLLGKSFALLGIMIVLMQDVLAARYRWFEKYFGFDIIIRFHKYIALFGAALLLLHPFLLAAGGRGWDLLYDPGVSFPVYMGRVTLLFLIANVVLSAFRKNLSITFERWRLLHDVFAFALVALAFTHSWLIASDLKSFTFLRVLWVGFLVAEVGILVNHLFIRPRMLRKNAYTVSGVEKESRDVWTLKMSPSDSTIFHYAPGQFHFITLKRGRGLPEEEHHFTISSSPMEERFLSSTIKESGDFTSTIGQTKTGDKALIQGPFGRFSYVYHPGEKRRTFIAGGIGITPIISMLRFMKDTKDDAETTLLYANKTEADILFRRELESMGADKELAVGVVFVLSKPSEDWMGEKGHIGKTMIERYCRDVTGKHGFYVVGPDPMRKSLVSALGELGVSDRHVHTEIFKFVD